MPAYIFRLPANATSRPVTLYAVAPDGTRTQVGTGTTDASATYTTTLDVGNYVASVRVGAYRYETAEELVNPVVNEALDAAALKAAFVARDELGDAVTAADLGAYTAAETNGAIGAAIAAIPSSVATLQIVPVGYFAAPVGVISNLAAAINTPTVTPLVIPSTMTFDQIGIKVVTAGTTGSVVRLAVFASDANGYPGSSASKRVETAALDATTTGVKTATISLTLSAGIYWVAAVTQVAAATLEGVSMVVPAIPINSGDQVGGLTAGSVTGTFFSGYGPTGGSGQGPRVRLRRSA